MTDIASAKVAATTAGAMNTDEFAALFADADSAVHCRQAVPGHATLIEDYSASWMPATNTIYVCFALAAAR